MKEEITIEKIIHIFSEGNKDRCNRYIALLIQKGESIIPLLIQFLEHENVRIRYYSIIALGKFKTPEVAEVLIKHLDDKELYGACAYAAESALMEIGAEDILIKNLKDKAVCGRIARMLGSMKSKKAVPYLIQYLNECKDDKGRSWCIKALGEIGDTSAMEILKESLNDSYKWVRYFSAEALLKMGNKSGITTLIEAQHDVAENNTEISEWATELLGK